HKKTGGKGHHPYQPQQPDKKFRLFHGADEFRSGHYHGKSKAKDEQAGQPVFECCPHPVIIAPGTLVCKVSGGDCAIWMIRITAGGVKPAGMIFRLTGTG
ncbi:MAG: hypothetical protein ACNA7H_04405, partial [Desulfotignum sp.]